MGLSQRCRSAMQVVKIAALAKYGMQERRRRDGCDARTGVRPTWAEVEEVVSVVEW